MVYLGSVLCSDGSSGSEVSRRIGSARAELDKLSRVWKHAGISSTRKLNSLEACVMSKLLFNLHALCLTKVESRRLDAFHVKCLRQVLRIPHSFYSRASNETVLTRAQARPASQALMERQLLWMGKLAARSDCDPLRQTIFHCGPRRMELKGPEGRKKRGRPKQNWAQHVYRKAVEVAGNDVRLRGLWQGCPSSMAEWDRLVRQCCRA